MPKRWQRFIYRSHNKKTLKKLLEDEISPREPDRFFNGVRTFYKAAYEHCAKWLPLDNDLLKSCRFIDFSRRSEFSFDDVQCIVSAFPLNKCIIAVSALSWIMFINLKSWKKNSLLIKQYLRMKSHSMFGS